MPGGLYPALATEYVKESLKNNISHRKGAKSAKVFNSKILDFLCVLRVFAVNNH
jgi:hypothetical protein